tara:strand:- start:326 stop:598 length:273 start_codon:yes stop_codon:yes gene_type:complete
MDSKVKIKGDDFEFECDLKTITLDDRKELRVLFHKLNNKKYIEENGYFPVSVEIIQKSTVMSDEQINELTDAEIYALALEIINLQNKKKV